MSNETQNHLQSPLSICTLSLHTSFASEILCQHCPPPAKLLSPPGSSVFSSRLSILMHFVFWGETLSFSGKVFLTSRDKQNIRRQILLYFVITSERVANKNLQEVRRIYHQKEKRVVKHCSPENAQFTIHSFICLFFSPQDFKLPGEQRAWLLC